MGSPLRDRPAGHGNAAGRIRGAVIGVVTNDTDPENWGRVKVRYPWLHDQIESNWARVVSMYAGPGRGGYYMPEVGDEVLLMFEDGDPNMPYVVGSLWNGKDKIPGPGNLDGKNNTKMFQSRSGHFFKFEDTDGAEKITLQNNNGKLKMIIDVAADSISLIADTGDIFFKAPSGPITLNCKDMKVTASGKTNVSVGDGHTESSQNRTEQVAANCGATAKDAFTISTKTLAVSFGSGSVSAATSSMSVDGPTTQTMGTMEFEGAVVHRTTGPETLTAGMLEVHAKQVQIALSGPATMTTAVMEMTSNSDCAIESAAVLTVMGGLINYDGGASISVAANLVTLC